jgi:type III restriction enzyme
MTPRVLYAISEPHVEELIVKAFTKSFRDLTFKEEEPKQEEMLSVRDVKPFVWTRPVFAADKCIFSYVPCDNELEVEFARFLNRSGDLEAFTKNEKLGFFLECISLEGGLKNFKPDFVVKAANNKFYIFETKGEVDINVPIKDARARTWCDDSSKIVAQQWHYERVDQKLFEAHHYDSLDELLDAKK